MRCLILQKNRTIANIVKKGLEAYGYIVDKEIISENLSEKIRRRLYRLIFVDLAVQDDEEMNYSIRELVDVLQVNGRKGLLFGIGSKKEWKKRVNFLKAGGDDVISYPFLIQELLARIQSLLRRPQISNAEVVRIDDVKIDTSNKKVFHNSKPLDLRRKEYSILEYMARNPNRPISRSELLDHVWDYKRITGSNTVDVHISQLRNKLEKPKLIETVYGFGYMLNDSASLDSDGADEHDPSKRTKTQIDYTENEIGQKGNLDKKRSDSDCIDYSLPILD